MIRLSGGELLIATRNPGKIQEMMTLLQHLNLRLTSALDLTIPDPEETGETFEENALIKAKAYAQAAGIPALADDSGLCVDALEGFPGVHTARFATEHGGHENAAKVLEQMLKGKSLKASFCSCVVLRIPNGQSHVAEARIPGTLVFPPRGDKGWGFNPIFQPDGYPLTYGEMTSDKKIQVDHRATAVRQLLQKIEFREQRAE
jgi:XTP/dITP diphosphohydrolase